MAELKNRQWLLAARPHGIIKESDFRWNETLGAAAKDGQILVRNLAFSFDPTQRGWMSMDTYIPAIPIGQVMKAGAVGAGGRIEAARYSPKAISCRDFSDGRTTRSTTARADGHAEVAARYRSLLALSLLGTTGLTAYFGTLAVGAGEGGRNFVVSGAAGATGSVPG